MQLSNSALGIFVECPRCFYKDRKLKKPRPRGIFSSLPNGIDGLLKIRLDNFRGKLPPEMDMVQLDGWTLFKNMAILAKRRQWNASDLVHEDGKGNKLVGAVDDILERADGMVAPLDYKTKGSEPDQAYCEKYYQRQLDLYALLLEKKHKVADFGVLLYFWPVEDKENLIRFESKPFILQVSPERGRLIFDEAIKCLEGDLPAEDPKCEYCKYLSA